mmetsp:Transcript_60304/g.168460  ORF Transcript_60304/g.168460 Transcript_60304/m.168460 type:complete len:136 (-) Transcript_60304:141-548(-)
MAQGHRPENVHVAMAMAAEGSAAGAAQQGAAGSPDGNVTYQFKGEDHTLGNAMRYMLMKNPDVEFAGYTVPHPSEPYMNVRVQTHEGVSADDAALEALENIIQVCSHVSTVYKKAVVEYEARGGKEAAGPLMETD